MRVLEKVKLDVPMNAIEASDLIEKEKDKLILKELSLIEAEEKRKLKILLEENEKFQKASFTTLRTDYKGQTELKKREEALRLQRSLIESPRMELNKKLKTLTAWQSHLCGPMQIMILDAIRHEAEDIMKMERTKLSKVSQALHDLENYDHIDIPILEIESSSDIALEISHLLMKNLNVFTAPSISKMLAKLGDFQEEVNKLEGEIS